MGLTKKQPNTKKPIIITPKNKNKKVINCCQWNIKRGLVKHELEIKNLLVEEKIDIMFLTETDSFAINKESDYLIKGYQTILPKTSGHNSKIRIITLIKNEMMNKVKVRRDLMSENFPSIWVEVSERFNKSTIIAGFYREWSHSGVKSCFPHSHVIIYVTEGRLRSRGF